MNIGLVGCGRVAQLHMCAYRHIPEANVVAVSDINFEKAKAFAQTHGIPKTFKDYSELFEIKDLDYVDICTPTSTHAKIACEVAKSGHNILLEKPMARSTKDCDQIIHEVSKHKVKLCVCHNQLFIPYVAQLKNMADSGEFPLIYFRVSIKENAQKTGLPKWITTPEEGGVLWEMGCHSAYLQLHFLKDIDNVFAAGDKIKNPVHDNIVALIHTSNQTLGVIELSLLTKRDETMFDLMSSNGKRIQILSYNYLLETPEKPPANFLKGFYLDQKMIIKKWTKSVVENIRKGDLLTCLYHYNLISKFMQSIKDDSDSPVKPEDGRKTIQLLECIEESINIKQAVRMRNAAY
jgi:predicted dehydrogenase